MTSLWLSWRHGDIGWRAEAPRESDESVIDLDATHVVAVGADRSWRHPPCSQPPRGCDRSADVVLTNRLRVVPYLTRYVAYSIRVECGRTRGMIRSSTISISTWSGTGGRCAPRTLPMSGGSPKPPPPGRITPVFRAGSKKQTRVRRVPMAQSCDDWPR